jgi:hypothetical protein
MHVGYWNGEVEERALRFEGGGGAGEKTAGWEKRCEKPWERANARGTR